MSVKDQHIKSCFLVAKDHDPVNTSKGKSKSETHPVITSKGKSDRLYKKNSITNDDNDNSNSILLELVDAVKENNHYMKDIISRLPMVNPMDVAKSLKDKDDKVEDLDDKIEDMESDEEENRRLKNEQERRNVVTGSTRAENDLMNDDRPYNVMTDWNTDVCNQIEEDNLSVKEDARIKSFETMIIFKFDKKK